MSILIRDVQVEGDVTQVYIEGNRIVEIGRKREADTVIDGKGKIALPGLVNLHTHAAMTLFRGWGDDLDLSTWLETKIWPAEAKLTADDVYWGTKLACLTETGARPAKCRDGLGFLAKDVIAAHGCWLDPSEIELLARTGTRVAHCPISNMKLSTGQAMPYAAMKEAAVVMGLGTDGAASNNNLDMFETMKVAALLQKFAHRDPTVLPSLEAFQLATFGGARALGIDAGLIGVDRLADLILIDPRRPELTPRHNDISNWVYSAHGNVVDTMICDGAVLMRGRRVRGEAEILEKAAGVARDLVSRV